MKVTIEEIDRSRPEEILVRCHEINDEIMRIVHKLKTDQNTVIGMEGEEMHRLRYEDIFYFETVENRSFIYCRQKVYETKLKLYEFQRLCEGSRFFRASKSVVVNSDKIDFVRPSISGRFEAVLENGEMVIVSRQYVPDLKKILGL